MVGRSRPVNSRDFRKAKYCSSSAVSRPFDCRYALTANDRGMGVKSLIAFPNVLFIEKIVPEISYFEGVFDDL